MTNPIKTQTLSIEIVPNKHETYEVFIVTDSERELVAKDVTLSGAFRHMARAVDSCCFRTGKGSIVLLAPEPAVKVNHE